jgi:hypothetical protein
MRVNPTHRKLLGESVREIGVLVLVFVPLDVIVGWNSDRVLSYPNWMSWMEWLSPQHFITVFFALSGIILLTFGIIIEAKASEEEKGGEPE